LHAGDIIVTNTEQGFEYLLIGYPAIVPKYFGETGIFSHHIFRVRPLPTSPLKTHYLYFLLMDPFVRDQIIGCTNGTTVNMLSADGLRTPKFRLPPKELIDQFELFATPIFEKKELLYKESRTLEILRDTLLPKLMRGEVRVRRP
jgi:type I restriction enzyme S subunit